MALRPWDTLLALLLVVAGVTACTDEATPPPPAPAPEPSPSATGPAGLRVGIVLPPPAGPGDPQIAQLEGDMRPLQGMLPDEITQLRHVTADGPEFVGDLARLLIDRGTELVCMVGDDVMPLANQLAARHPERTFCVAPGASREAPDNVRVVDVRTEELGHVAGVAAAAAVDAEDPAAEEPGADESAEDGDADAPPGAVALVLATDRLGHERFRDGVRAGVGGTELLEWFPQDADAAHTAVHEAIGAGADVLILDVGWDPRALLGSVADADLRLLAPMTALAGADFESDTVLAWSLRWEEVLAPVVAQFVDREVEAPTSLGLREDVFVITPGAEADSARIDQVVTDLREGRRAAVPGAPPTPDPVTPPDDGEAGAEQPNADAATPTAEPTSPTPPDR